MKKIKVGICIGALTFVMCCTFHSKAAGWNHSNGVWTYDNNGQNVIDAWKILTNKWYYFNCLGIMTHGWEKINGKWYYLGSPSDGAMKSGWQKINGQWYYLGSPNDGSMKSGWQKINGQWYYLGSPNDGSMKSGWRKINDQWYYLGSPNDGSMKSGWRKINDQWYYLGSPNDGSMKSGWQEINGQWYYLGSPNDGSMKSGWQKINGQWYYFGASEDGAMKTGWLNWNGKRYYLKADGAMAIGKIEINHKMHQFNDNGEEVNYRADFEPPEGFVLTAEEAGIKRFVKQYKGIDTSDVIIYDEKEEEYVFYRNQLSSADLEKLDIDRYIANEQLLLGKFQNKSGLEFKKYIRVYDGSLTCLLTVSKVENEVFTIDVYNLRDNKEITEKINLFDDVW